MQKFIVQIDVPESVENLKVHGEVGNPQTLTTFIILKSEKTIEEIRATKGVVEVQLDERMDLNYIPSTQENAPQWALPWISNHPTDYFNTRSGQGVDIYILDTGVRDTHYNFGNRVRNLWSFDDVFWSTIGDISPEHGTAVAGCAAGSQYGTAKNATIVNVRIDFMTSTIVKALDIIVKDHIDKDPNRPSVLNFSGSSPYQMIGALFDKLPTYGIVPVAAAGNHYPETKPRWPARSGWVTGVGAINDTGGPAYFSNLGGNMYAPGQSITTSSVSHDHGVINISGTSFAAPYVAGLMACLLEGSDRFNTSFQVSTFAHMFQMQLCDHTRVPTFPNGGTPVRTVNSNNTITGDYYVNGSFDFSDEEIAYFVTTYMNDPQQIANAARDYNIDLNRLSAATGYPKTVINQFFIDVGVRPWWFTDDDWLNANPEAYILESMVKNDSLEYIYEKYPPLAPTLIIAGLFVVSLIMYFF